MTYQVISYYSNGYVVEHVDNGSEPCESFIPAENLWPKGLRGFLYILAILYMFLGVAIASDIFMSSIEVITSKKRKVVKWDAEKQQNVEREVLIWNDTVANLTLMALGSSAPEILLAVGETLRKLGSTDIDDSLGTFTIIGSAAFNLLIITSICIVSVPHPDIKSIREFGVFLITSVWSLWAYVWMLLVVKFISPGEIEPWEAWVTLAYMPIFVLQAYFVDSGCFCCKKKRVDTEDDAQEHIRIMTNQARKGSIAGHMLPGKELHVLEAEKQQRLSMLSLRSIDKKNSQDEAQSNSVSHTHLSISPSVKSSNNISLQFDNNSNQPGKEEPAEQRLAKLGVEQKSQTSRARTKPISSSVINRARFRHAVVSAMTGTKKKRVPSATKAAKFAELVKQVTDQQKGKMPTPGDLFGKFTFATEKYHVLESKGELEVEVLFHRNLTKTPQKAQIVNGDTVAFRNGATQALVTPVTADPAGKQPGSQVFEGVVAVEYETREGSGKAGRDFKYNSGTLTFKESDYKQSIHIEIINDGQFTGDKDFYIILKNPNNSSALGDPSVTRVTVLDDDEPGEFHFEESHNYADMKQGIVTLKVVRENGMDGKIQIEYSTTDGTARGGESIGKDVDYVSVTKGKLEFQHEELEKTITVKVNKDAKGSKNFIVALKNPGLGAKIGERSAAICHLNKESIEDRIAEVIDLKDEDEEEITWAGQFRNAMTIEGGQDDDGKEIPPKWSDYVLHFLTFFWKILGAMVPPTNIWGAWPAFVFSLVYIGALTACVEQLGHLIGCVIGLKTSVTGITIIALGTSLPDTFASRTAAKQDEHADASIGNVTGSNSVNVFLGLGLPWVLSTMYAVANGTTYKVAQGNLTQSVIIFSVLGTCCIIILILRRKFVGGELGGKNPYVKWGTSIVLFFMWCIYIILASLKAYDIITWEI